MEKFDDSKKGSQNKIKLDFVTVQCYTFNVDKEKKEYVLYKGEKFTVEWYYTEKNKSQPFDYFN